MDFKAVFNDYRNLIINRLSEILDERSKEFNKRVEFETDVFEVLENFSSKGKMLRGSLLLFSVNSYGKKIDVSVLDLAVSLELMHSALLIHDDIMDNDELRRGEKTIFARYEELAKQSNFNDAKHVGISMGIVVGDIALFIAQELSTSAEIRIREVLSFYAKELRTVGLGQLLDYSYGIRNEEYSVEQIERMYLDKSARYTFTLPLYMGALYAGADKLQLDLIEKLSEKLGLIFQLIDDDLGMFGDDKELGKPIGSDIKENKKTFLRSLLISKADKSNKDYLVKCFGNRKLSKKDIGKIREMITELGIREEISKKIERLNNDSRKIIQSLNVESKYKRIYSELLDYNVKRTF